MKYAPALNVCAKCALRTVTVTSESVTWANSLDFSYQIKAKGSPYIFGATNLPSGLSVDTTTGIISGRLSTLGIYTINLSATNKRNSTGIGELTLTIVNGYMAVTFTNHTGGSPNAISLLGEISQDGGAYVTINTATTYNIFQSLKVRTTVQGGVNISSGGASLATSVTAMGGSVTLKSSSVSTITGNSTSGSLAVQSILTNLNGNISLNPVSVGAIDETSLVSGVIPISNVAGISHSISAPDGSGALSSCQFITEIDF